MIERHLLMLQTYTRSHPSGDRTNLCAGGLPPIHEFSCCPIILRHPGRQLRYFATPGQATTIKCAGWPTYRTATFPIICPCDFPASVCGGRDTDEQTIDTGP